MGTMTDWSRVGVLVSDLRTTPLVPKGVVPWVLLRTAPMDASGAVAAVSLAPCLLSEGPRVAVFMGESTCGELNSKRSGVRRKDSPGTCEATVPSRQEEGD